MVWEAVQLSTLGFFLVAFWESVDFMFMIVSMYLFCTLCSNVQGAEQVWCQQCAITWLACVDWVIEATGHGGSRINALLISQLWILLGVFAGFKNRFLQHAVSCQGIERLPLICYPWDAEETVNLQDNWVRWRTQTALFITACLQKPRASVIASKASFSLFIDYLLNVKWKKWENKHLGIKKYLFHDQIVCTVLNHWPFVHQIKQLVVQATRQIFSCWRWICDSREKITYQQSMKDIISALNRDEVWEKSNENVQCCKGLIGVGSPSCLYIKITLGIFHFNLLLKYNKHVVLEIECTNR